MAEDSTITSLAMRHAGRSCCMNERGSSICPARHLSRPKNDAFDIGLNRYANLLRNGFERQFPPFERSVHICLGVSRRNGTLLYSKREEVNPVVHQIAPHCTVRREIV